MNNLNTKYNNFLLNTEFIILIFILTVHIINKTC